MKRLIVGLWAFGLAAIIAARLGASAAQAPALAFGLVAPVAMLVIAGAFLDLPTSMSFLLPLASVLFIWWAVPFCFIWASGSYTRFQASLTGVLLLTISSALAFAARQANSTASHRRERLQSLGP